MAAAHPAPAPDPAPEPTAGTPAGTRVAPETITPAAMVPELGMRRVRWVRISVSDDGVRAEVAGIAHRFPVIRRVPLRWANTLIRSGCPYVVRHDRPASGAEAG